MATESVIWTLLPDGSTPRPGTCARRSSSLPVCAPAATRERLTRSRSFRHWPDALDLLKFEAEVDGIGTVELEHDRVGVRDPATWDLLFGGPVFVDETEVRTSEHGGCTPSPPIWWPTRSSRCTPRSRPTTRPTTPHPPPAAHRPGGRPRPDRRLPAGGGRPPRPLSGWTTPRAGPAGRFVRPRRGPALTAARQAALPARQPVLRPAGGDRLRDRGRSRRARRRRRPAHAELDFHAYVAAFGDYRHLLRRLGLAIDVRMRPDPALAGAHRYRVLVNGDPQPWMNDLTATPWLNYRWYDDRWFVPRTRDDGRFDVAEGQLLLESVDLFSVHQIDIDGSALKTTNTASTIARAPRAGHRARRWRRRRRRCRPCGAPASR